MPIHAAGAVIAFFIGMSISLVNYLLSKKILITHPDQYAITTVMRQFLNVAYLVVCFFIAEHTAVNLAALLIGAVLGLTLSSFYFTWKLLKINKLNYTGNQAPSKNNESDHMEEKEDEAHG